MKYLVTFARRDGVPLPPESIADILRTQREWIEDRIGGSIDCGYVFAQGAGGIAIVNAESNEALAELVASAPAFLIANVEVKPLASMSALEHAARALHDLASVTA